MKSKQECYDAFFASCRQMDPSTCSHWSDVFHHLAVTLALAYRIRAADDNPGIKQFLTRLTGGEDMVALIRRRVGEAPPCPRCTMGSIIDGRCTHCAPNDRPKTVPV